MTERSFILPGNTVGDAVLAPMASEDLADWLFFTYEWYPATEVGANVWFDSYRPYVYGKPIDGNIVPIRGAILSDPNTTPTLTNFTVNTSVAGGWVVVYVRPGKAIVDGRVYMNTATVQTGLFPLPLTTRYFAVGIEVDTVAQTARLVNDTGVMLGGYATPAEISMIANSRRKSDSYFAAVAILKCNSVDGILAFHDMRRIIHPDGFQAVVVPARQGGDLTDWSVPGTTNYNLDNNVSLIPFKMGYSMYPVENYLFRPTTGFPNFPIGIGTAHSVANDPQMMCQVYPVSEQGNLGFFVYTRFSTYFENQAVNGVVIGDRSVDQLSLSGYTPIGNYADENYHDYIADDTTY